MYRETRRLARVPSQNSILLACAVAGAAIYAALQKEPAPVVSEARNVAAPVEHPNDEPEGESLPPNHPPIGTPPPQDDIDPREQSAALSWKAPARWSVLPNASSMRLATYRIPAAPGVTGDAELTVVRAGGSVDANLDRWVAQFTDAEPAKRSKKTVNGLTVSLLEVSGTFMDAGPAMGGTKTPRAGWMLSGAVVETAGGTYFFKLTGPAASVRAARADFDAFVNGLAPASSSPAR